MHTKKQKKYIPPPKAAAIRLTLLLFPMCTKPRARYQNSESPKPTQQIAIREQIELHPSQRDFSSPISHIYC